MKKIAVIILNWNGEKLLRQFLPSVIQFSPEAEIYVADNASTDMSIEVLQNEFPSVKIIKNTENFGFAKGYNKALKEVNEPILALVNSDIEVTKNWLTPILSQFENEPKTAVIQPKILDFKKKTHFEYAGAGGGFIDKYGFPFCRGRVFETVEEDFGQYNDATKIFWASGACFFIRNSVFKQLNGFDADFFAHQEEIDLCWRAKNAGFTIKYNPLSTVYHVGGATLNVGNPQKTYLNFRNSLWMLTKNLPKNKLFSILFLRLCLDGFAGIKFFFQGNFSHTWAIIKAHFSLYGNFKKFYRKRPTETISGYYKINSVVYSYFFKGKKKFSDIF